MAKIEYLVPKLDRIYESDWSKESEQDLGRDQGARNTIIKPRDFLRIISKAIDQPIFAL